MRKMLYVILSCAAAAAVVLLSVMVLLNRTYVVGKSIQPQSVTQFYHTVSTTTNPAQYQRYHFYEENGAHFFFHETRMGNHWPLTEEDAAVKGIVQLTDAQWAQLLELLDGGSVCRRGETAVSGGSGPWMYLYWTGDRGKVQEFAFASQEKEAAFEEFCLKLKGEGA